MPEPGPQTPCPRCGGYTSRVVDVARELLPDAVLHTARRRRCLSCGGRYTTVAHERVLTGSYSSRTRRTFSLTVQVIPICGADIPST